MPQEDLNKIKERGRKLDQLPVRTLATPGTVEYKILSTIDVQTPISTQLGLYEGFTYKLIGLRATLATTAAAATRKILIALKTNFDIFSGNTHETFIYDSTGITASETLHVMANQYIGGQGPVHVADVGSSGNDLLYANQPPLMLTHKSLINGIVENAQSGDTLKIIMTLERFQIG